MTVGGVEYVAECFQKILGGDIVAFQPNEKVKFLLFDRNKPELSPKKALNIKNQYLPLNPTFYIKLLKKILNSKKILIHMPTLGGFIAIFLSFLLLKKIIVFQHSRSPTKIGKIFFFITYLLARFEFLKIIVTSKHEQKFSRLSKYSIVINLPLSNDRKFSFEENIIGDRLKLVFIGRLVPYKGILEFLDSLNELIKKNLIKKKIELTIIGEGELKREIIKRKERTNFQINISSWLTESEKFKKISESNALVLPSINSGEAFGLVQLDALTVGRPVLLKKQSSGTQDYAWKNPVVFRYNNEDLEISLNNLIDFIEQSPSGTIFNKALNKYSFENFKSSIIKFL